MHTLEQKMNVIELIKKQIEQIAKSESSIFLDSIIIHLERAEYYYSLGENDSYYFNDVIYRTNQAYEGALKEAYKILANKSKSEVVRETPFKIEKYFEDNGIFKERVLELFKNYRNEWRNKSTHDYKLFFDANESFIAINSVSAFTYLLLNQIIEKLAFEYEKDKIKKSKKSTLKLKEEGLKVARGLFEIMTLTLSETIDYSDLKTQNPRESELSGFLKANFDWFINGAKIDQEAKLNGNLRPDFIIEFGGEKIILEIKKYSKTFSGEQLISQLLTYLKNSDITEGIGFSLNPSNDFKPMNISEHLIDLDNKQYKIRIINN